jgi:hypothetical protein
MRALFALPGALNLVRAAGDVAGKRTRGTYGSAAATNFVWALVGFRYTSNPLQLIHKLSLNFASRTWLCLWHTYFGVSLSWNFRHASEQHVARFL